MLRGNKMNMFLKKNNTGSFIRERFEFSKDDFEQTRLDF